MRAAALALVLLAGCYPRPEPAMEFQPEVVPFDVPADSGKMALLLTHRFAPPKAYRRWYAAIERCAGMTGDFDRVRWYVTPEPWPGRGTTVFGMHSAGAIIVNEREIMDSVLVSHEALHHVLYVNGWRQPKNASIRDMHPAPFGRCSGVYHEGPTP